MTNLTLPALRRSEGPRIINLSSRAQAPVSGLLISGKEQQTQSTAYAQSKLALTMWSFDLADREKDIIVIAVNPGSLLNTKMVKEAFGEHWSSAEKGSNILSELAVSEDYRNDSGKYFDNDKGEDRGMFSEAHADAYDKEKIAGLMLKTDEVLEGL